MKIDPYKHEEKYKAWKEKVSKKGIPNMSKANSDLTLKYLYDMEYGLNVSMSSTKGGRGYPRLNTLREKMGFFARSFKEHYDIDDLTKLNENQVVLFFSKMQKGDIKRRDGKPFVSTDYYVKVFKAFWHWWQNVNRKQGIKILDITTDLDSKGNKPKWVYLNEEQVRMLYDNAREKYRVLIMFMFDTGIRSPTELINLKVMDLHNNFKELHIRDEVSKTFGRRIKLMLSSELIKNWIQDQKLSPTDQIFNLHPSTVNKYLKRLAKKILGDSESLAGEKYSNLTMYDFRHCSCCYWLPRYKSESALKYRFGWKKSDKIHYYSELLGMKDTISDEDMFVDVTKTELEQKLKKAESRSEVLQERVNVLESQMQEVVNLLKASKQLM